jgi:gliding motility-associated-like protein
MKRIILPIVALLICNISNAQICSKAQLPFNLQNGLVGYYPFCGNANDGSGNGNNGVVSGATLTIDRFGNTNSAYNFNGTNNYITIANVAANTFTSTFSISVWVKPAAGYGSGSSPNGTQNQIVSKWGFAGVNNASYSLGVDQAGIAFTGVHNGSVSSSVNSSPSTISINEWHHLVSTLSGGVLRLYVDNVLVKTISNSVNAQNSRYTLDIAREALGNYSYFKGVIDDIQIYNRALTPCEVNQIYTSTNTTFTTPSILTFNPLPTKISLCGSSIGLDAGSGFTSYLWNTGATSQTISATTAGEYRVTVTNASGCTASDTINVSLVKADILQSDQTVCVNTPLTLSVNSYANQSAKTIDFDNVGLAALDVTGGTAGSVSGVSGNGLSISRPTEVKTKDQTYGYGDYEVDAKTGTNTSNQYLSVLLPLNSWTNEAISIDSRPAGTDDVGWGVYVNAVRVAFATGSHPAGASTWYKMKIRVTPDSVKCWINSTLLYQGLNTTVPRNIGAVKLSTFSTSHFDNLKYIPYQTFSSVLWSTSATTSTISVTPTATTTYYATISDGISSCRDSVTLTVANIVGFAPLQDTVKVCGDSLVLDAGAGFASYSWSNGATTRIVTAKTSGRYIATVFNASGCSASDTSVVSIVKAKILQRDTTICKGSSITLAVDSIFSGRSICNKNSLPIGLQNGLVAYYPFCGNTNDASGNGINSVGSASLSADRFGNTNSAYKFSEIGQGLVSDSINQVVTNKTISAWVKFSNMTQKGGVLVSVYVSSVFDGIYYSDTLGGWGIYSNFIYAPSGIKETSSNWVMLTATYENNSCKLYRNGVLILNVPNLPLNSFPPSSRFSVQSGPAPPISYPNLNGIVDDVFFYNRVLTSSEIMSLYNSSSSVNWSNGATSNTITVSPTVTTKYFVTVTDGITTCRDSITVAVSDIGSYNPLQDTVKVCGDSLVLDAGAGYARYNWSNGATTRTISVKASGKYFVTVANASGCSASDTSVVSVINANILQSDTTICRGSNLSISILSLKSGQTALWSTGATTSSITVNPTVKTTYRVTVTDGITTCRDSIVVDVSSSELKVTDPAAVCSPAVIDLTAAALTTGSANGLTYTYWRDSTATQALANPDKVSVSGTYYIVGTSSTGCTSAPTAVKVTVNPLPVATIIAPTQTAICDKSSITLTARGGTSYQWLLNGSAIAGAIDSTYAASQAGSYEVNVVALGCTSKVAAPVNLTLIKAAVPKFSNSSTCIDVPVSFFNETDTTLSGSVNWLWDFGDGQTSTLSNPVYTYKKSGTFVVKLKVAPKLCSSLSDSITKNITVDVPPIGIKYPNVLAVKNKATPLSARFIANGYTYLWMPSTGLNNGAIQKPIFNSSTEQLYRVRLTSAGGCITMDSVKVSVYDSSDIFVPKAFSPNKDGKNDILQPFLVNIVTLKFFKVYNRWGQLMFQTSDSRLGWDGMYNNKHQPLEAYTWIAEGIDGNGTTIFRKGQTVLIR